MNRTQQGFTAVELLVALVVGVLLLLSAYQLHTSVIHAAADAQHLSQASNVAYDILRQTQTDTTMVTMPCTTHTSTPVMPTYASLTDATVNVAVTCPYAGSPDLSLVTVTVNYSSNGQTQQVYRAITTRAS